MQCYLVLLAYIMEKILLNLESLNALKVRIRMANVLKDARNYLRKTEIYLVDPGAKPLKFNVIWELLVW